MTCGANTKARFEEGYQLVTLANGVRSIRSLAVGETFHPVVGPVAEAQALYVAQLRIRERVAAAGVPFVIWDVGLGAAANALVVLSALQDLARQVVLMSFDVTTEALRFALLHSGALPYLNGYEEPVRELITKEKVEFTRGRLQVRWQLKIEDFPALIASDAARLIPAPDAILFDAFSPARNPSMWNGPLFSKLYQCLDPQRPCAIATYSRSTMLRVTLLLAGFYVGVGSATGEKEETTIASNSWDLVTAPLGQQWLQRVKNSNSAEPMWQTEYRQQPLSENSWRLLLRHPQFKQEPGVANE